MARASSIISVSIIGDAKKLIGAVGDADRATGGLVKSTVKVVGGTIAVKKGFDILNDSLDEADRKGDAITRLQQSVGKIDTQKLEDTAGNFTEIGASSQDMLELEAAYADLAKSAGIAAPDIATSAEKMAIAAVAAARIHEEDPSAIIDAIGKASGGATRGLKPYGVDLTEAAVQQRAMHDTGKDNPKLLSDTELAAARTALILDGFAGITSDAALASEDLHDKQSILGAKVEEVGGKMGEFAEGPLTDVLQFILDEIDAIPAAVDGWGMLGDAIFKFGSEALAPLAAVNDLLQDILDNLSHVGQRMPQAAGPHAPTGFRDSDFAAAIARDRARNGLGQ